MSYITRQFDGLSGSDMRVKVTSSHGETNWISVNQEDAHAIEKILKAREDRESAALVKELGL